MIFWIDFKFFVLMVFVLIIMFFYFYWGIVYYDWFESYNYIYVDNSYLVSFSKAKMIFFFLRKYDFEVRFGSK